MFIIDSMTSVFNTDASLPYNHDLFESLIVKKRVKDTGVLKTIQCSLHYFIGDEVEQKWGEWTSLSDTTFCREAFGELNIHPHPPEVLATSLFISDVSTAQNSLQSVHS
ncbi:hypothetical protein T265_08872 [Opisthorchis viverrini]|uniref:Uncharacterized protein n=1 Tax=Opisthorchis viverrini TaxID=6198 RepID=A0A074Z7M6_OPIVI|nr:hypothetical protein T265_08872 [Opisthorchis viverrini]KER23176.1 hypothetical protein T265_08872 [Opisthorchis viverrini]